MIVERGPYAELRRQHHDEPVVDLGSGLLLPGFVDTHVHYPQMRAIGALGMPLLEWLDRCALPEEARLEDVTYAREVAGEFVASLVDSGTTTALVFGSHFAPAVDALFEESAGRGLRITCGLVVGDRMLRPELHTTAQRAYDEARRAGAAMAPERPRPVRGHAALLVVLHRRAAGIVRGRAQRRRGLLVHLAHQREPGGGRQGAGAVRMWLPREL